MSKERQTSDLSHSVLSANVLDDPRWEKLALGTASTDEIEALRTWAQHSHMARRAWDLFRPSSEKEKAALTVAVLKKCANRGQHVGTQRVRPDESIAMDVRAKPADVRMMSRHARRESMPTLRELATDKISTNVRSLEETRAIATLGAENAASTKAKAKKKNRSRERSLPQASFRDPSGTTSSTAVVSRDVVDTSSFVGAVASTLPVRPLAEPPSQKWDAQWFVLAATALFFGLCILSGVMLLRGEPMVARPHNVSPTASSADFASGVRPEMTIPSNVGSDKPTPPPSVSASASAVRSRALSPIELLEPKKQPTTKSPPAAYAPPNKPGYREVCTGAGIFQRCKKVPVEHTHEKKLAPRPIRKSHFDDF